MYGSRSVRKLLFASGLVFILTALVVLFTIGPSGFENNQLLLMLDGIGLLLFSRITQSDPVGAYWRSLLSAAGLFSVWASLLRGSRLILSDLTLLMVVSFFAVAVRSLWNAISNKGKGKAILFSHLMALSILFSIAFTFELLSCFFVPPWPAREIRPVKVFGAKYNSWGLRDTEREIRKLDGQRRVIFVGDSFLDGGFSKQTLAGYTHEELLRSGFRSLECINLGVSATGPKQYLYRLREFGLRLSPDLVLVYIFEGNDLIADAYGMEKTRFVAERPIPSILGSFMPHFTWLVVNRFNLSEAGAKDASSEFSELKKISEMSYEQGLPALASYMQKNYFPELPTDKIEQILNRGGPSFWKEFQPRATDREYFQGWWVASLIGQTLQQLRSENRPAPRDMKLDTTGVSATTSYVLQIVNTLKKKGIEYHVFLIPVAENVDPSYVAFRRHWVPQNDHFARNHDFRRKAFYSALTHEGVSVTDLADFLDGIPGVYRKSDGHWTTKGHLVLAKLTARIISEQPCCGR